MSKILITYIANEGFVLSNDKLNIIIDGIFKSEGSDYPAPSDKFINNLKNSKQLFAKPSIILFTHDHWDHFNVSL